jgi:hypothetical protein
MAAACCQRSRVEQTRDLQPAAWTAWVVPAHQLLPLLLQPLHRLPWAVRPGMQPDMVLVVVVVAAAVVQDRLVAWVRTPWPLWAQQVSAAAAAAAARSAPTATRSSSLMLSHPSCHRHVAACSSQEACGACCVAGRSTSSCMRAGCSVARVNTCRPHSLNEYAPPRPFSNPPACTYSCCCCCTQFARLLRSLGLAFILVTAVGAFLDEKSLGKGLLMSNPDVKPQVDSSTR